MFCRIPVFLLQYFIATRSLIAGHCYLLRDFGLNLVDLLYQNKIGWSVFLHCNLHRTDSMAAPGSSMIYSSLLFSVILSLLQVYKGTFASSELMTIVGGLICSLLFLLMLTVSSQLLCIQCTLVIGLLLISSYKHIIRVNSKLLLLVAADCFKLYDLFFCVKEFTITKNSCENFHLSTTQP
jgi:Keratinocyte-associated protein 2